MPNTYTTANSQKRALFAKIARPLLVIALLALVYFAGMVTPVLRNKLAQRQAEKVAHAFIVDLTKEDYNAALDLTDDTLRQNVPTGDVLKELVGNVKSDAPKFGDKTVSGDSSSVSVSQIVDNLPKSQVGATSANFNIDLIKVGDSWKVLTVSVN